MVTVSPALLFLAALTIGSTSISKNGVAATSAAAAASFARRSSLSKGRPQRWCSVVPRGGSSASGYEVELESIKSRVLQKAYDSIEELKTKVVKEGQVVQEYGAKAEAICNGALEEFASSAPDAGDDAAKAAAYERTARGVESTIDAPLEVLYMKQLGYVRETALQKYRSAIRASSTGASEYEAMLQADSQFVRDAKALQREGSVGEWDYSAERSFLQNVMNNMAESGRKATEVQMESGQKQQVAMQFLQSQQQMIQQLQMQLYGQTSPWNVGVAYRIPETNFNLQGSYQQGRANVQLSCVPDEYAPLLGPNGFTQGVGPGNLGLSLNLSI